MLKITILDTAAEQRFVLEGRLTEPWLSEVESGWRAAKERRQSRQCLVDLSGVISIDKGGEAALVGMQREGARFLAHGVCTRYRLERLGINCQSDVVPVNGTVQSQARGEI